MIDDAVSVVRTTDRTNFSLRSTRDASYGVTQLTRHVFDLDEPALRDAAGEHPVLIGIDEAVDRAYGAALRSYAATHLNTLAFVKLAGGEEHKSWEQVENICEAAIAANLPRNGTMIGVGGGVTLDLVGMAAALYRRGVPYVRVPTTLVGMIDVAVGVKHAVNFGNKKNSLGVFYPPFAAINDPTFLRTVTRRDLACGVAETIKIALVADFQLLGLLEEHLPTLLESGFQEPRSPSREILERAQFAMMQELAPNLFECDLKRAVDFGHSISPLLECRSDYRLAHGEAVAIDMLLSTVIAIQRGLCRPCLFERLVHLYFLAGLPLIDDVCNIELLIDALDETRSHRGGRLNFVVPNGLGSAVFLQQIDVMELRIALDFVREAAHFWALTG